MKFVGGTLMAIIVTFARSLTASTRSIARVCQAGATALSFEDYGLRDPGEVSHGAVGRFIPGRYYR
jgi:hypothetical protein